MPIQAPHRTIPALITLEEMLLQYLGLENNPDNREEVVEALELGLMELMDQEWVDGEQWENLMRPKYLYRVLECMLQQRCTPLPEWACYYLEDIPERLRGLESFMDLEAETLDPSPNDSTSSWVKFSPR
ncbi:unnamed protein product [Rhizoctonia solani]|uniref:Uncharacterized protein n=1 Tax=Rhizoctonia solani TaxID=456999 RepID=A0A8H3B3D4_9AGAM|nr:unnamed protein product [Rhizoctonia solani]